MGPVLSVRHLSIKRGRRRIYDDFTLDLHGGVTALLGPNGAGKTTLLDALANPRVGQGELVLDGASLRNGSDSAYLRQVGYMPQAWTTFPGFTARESVEYVAWLKGLPASRLSASAEEALRIVDLNDQRNVKVRRLSGGMKQRVGLAEALVNRPRVLLLDEPTVGLDPSQRNVFREALRRHGGSNRGAVLLSTHLTDDAASIADRVLVIDEGQLLFDGTPDRLASVGRRSGGVSDLESGYLEIMARATVTR